MGSARTGELLSRLRLPDRHRSQFNNEPKAERGRPQFDTHPVECAQRSTSTTLPGPAKIEDLGKEPGRGDRPDLPTRRLDELHEAAPREEAEMTAVEDPSALVVEPAKCCRRRDLPVGEARDARDELTPRCQQIKSLVRSTHGAETGARRGSVARSHVGSLLSVATRASLTVSVTNPGATYAGRHAATTTMRTVAGRDRGTPGTSSAVPTAQSSASAPEAGRAATGHRVAQRRRTEWR